MFGTTIDFVFGTKECNLFPTMSMELHLQE